MVQDLQNPAIVTMRLLVTTLDPQRAREVARLHPASDSTVVQGMACKTRTIVMTSKLE